MELVTCKLTVYFDDPFWVGVYERIEDGRLEASRTVFGSEPKDYEVYDYFNRNWSRLQLSPPVDYDGNSERIANPKRIQRAVTKQLSQNGVGTKAQQALKLQFEQNKTENKAAARKSEDEKSELKYELSQQKKKEKHRGR